MAEHRMWTVSEEEEGDDGEIDDVFEQGFSPNEHNEEASSCSPSSVIHISHSCVKGAVGGLVPGRLAPQLPVGGLWGSRGVGRAAHTGTSIISHLHPGFLENASPTPPTSPGTELVGLLTLHSLGGGHDSGYIPSPSSACSFTFSSDEEEPVAPGHPRPGVTPPIAIPQTQRRANSHAHRRPARPASPPGTPLLEDITPVRRGRTRSCPEDICALATSRTPVPKFPNSVAATASATPAHGRTCSMPATTPDGKPLLTPQQEYRTPVVTPRPSRDNLIDLSLEDGSPSSGHRRRVLVLALPDLVVDTEGRDIDACTPPSSHPVTSGFSRGVGTLVSRPAWQRHRALSCDVTLEEECGRELRKIADSFDFMADDDDDDGRSLWWRRLRNSFRRRR